MASVKKAFEWHCSSECWEEANRRACIRIKSEYKRDLRLSIPQRIEKIAIGYVGEFAFNEWCRIKDLPVTYLGEEIGNAPDHGDFLGIDKEIIDVKTQEVFYLPQNDWRCEVTDEQISRTADIYVFSKLYTRNSTRILMLVGWMTKKDFLEKAVFRKPGTILRGKPVHYAKWDVTIEELNDMSLLAGRLAINNGLL